MRIQGLPTGKAPIKLGLSGISSGLAKQPLANRTKRERKMKGRCIIIIVLLQVAVASNYATAETFRFLPGSRVIGDAAYVKARAHETLVDIARDNDLGYNEIVSANPTVNQWVVGKDTLVLLPKRRILPKVQEGIVLNVAELRLYYFPKPDKENADYRFVMTFPVSIGREAWGTPLQSTKVVAKERNPAWYPPESIREEHAAEGEYLPKMIPGGDPENPLGEFALRLGIKSYLIHGTDERKSYGIGMRVTHGCVRMYPEDIEWLYKFVKIGTPVQIIDQPIKIGWSEGNLLLSVFGPVDEDDDRETPGLSQVIEIINAEAHKFNITANEDAVRRATNIANGLPVVVASTGNLLPPALR